MTTTITTETQTAARIAALSGAVAPKDILKLAIASSLTNIDKSNLITALTAADLLVNVATSETDLIALNAARIAINKTLHDVDIGGFKEFTYNEDVITLNDGTVWLRKGLVETDLAKYPDAPSGISGLVYDSEASIVAGLSHSGGCYKASDASFYVTDDNGAYVYKLNAAYSNTGAYNLGTYFTTVDDIDWDGTHFWVVGQSSSKSRLVKYTSTFVYVDDFFLDHLGVDGATHGVIGIAFGNNRLWVYGKSTAFLISRDTGATMTVRYLGYNYQALSFDGKHFWAIYHSTAIEAVQFDDVFVRTGVEYTIIEDTLPRQIFFDGTDAIIFGDTLNKMFKYTTVEGVGTPVSISSVLGNVFMRVK